MLNRPTKTVPTKVPVWERITKHGSLDIWHDVINFHEREIRPVLVILRAVLDRLQRAAAPGHELLRARFLRFIPRMDYSGGTGAFRGKRMIGGGRAVVRKGLYMATLVATRHNPVIRKFYQHLLQQGKAKMTALTACMRKLLLILNAMLKENKTWICNQNT